MKRAAVAYILLGALALSGTGLARFVHILSHHLDPSAGGSGVVCATSCCPHHAPVKPAAPVTADDQEQHSPRGPSPSPMDDCQTCQMLAKQLAMAPGFVAVALQADDWRVLDNAVISRPIGCLRPYTCAARPPPQLLS